MRQQVLQFIDELMKAEPGVRASVEGSGASTWLTLSVPGTDLWWEVEFRAPDSIGLYWPARSPDDDVPFRKPDEHFKDMRSFSTRMFEVFSTSRAA